MRTACEKYYKRTGDMYQVRTESGRLVASSRHVEGCEFRVEEGRNRVLWYRFVDFGRVVWLSR